MPMQSSAPYIGQNEHILGCSAPGESCQELLPIRSFTELDLENREIIGFILVSESGLILRVY
jgi:hypothetical protein